MGLTAQNLATAAMGPLVPTSVEGVSARTDGWAPIAQCQRVPQISLEQDVHKFVPVKNITLKDVILGRVSVSAKLAGQVRHVVEPAPSTSMERSAKTVATARMGLFVTLWMALASVHQGTMEKIAVTIAQNTSMVRIVNWIVVVKMLLAAPMRVESVFVVQVGVASSVP